MSAQPENLTGRFSVHAMSRADDWETPRALFDELNAEFSFTTDVCASSENALCTRYFTSAENGLAQEWSGVCWMNPPYGREIARWMEKAHHASLLGATVVCLVPARTDTRWWHDYAEKASERRFLRGRLRFARNSVLIGDRSKGGATAPFPSAIVVFRPADTAQVREYVAAHLKSRKGAA